MFEQFQAVTAAWSIFIYIRKVLPLTGSKVVVQAVKKAEEDSCTQMSRNREGDQEGIFEWWVQSHVGIEGNKDAHRSTNQRAGKDSGREVTERVVKQREERAPT